ncbi:Methyltransferase domain-containing protein [Lachnospiraceae bacterium NE2001]|nr:Methyltransferase domain-containing protein [Lachnospiraceae bacterium NE2001]
MRDIKDLPAWERLFKKIVWKQLGDIEDKYILDFGSGEGITADHFAENNSVVAIEPWEDMLKDAWTDNEYRQIVGDIDSLKEFEDDSFDIIVCHNVLEYIDDKENVIRELGRVLKPDGFISLVKHNRNGRVMQMAVLLDDFDKANALLDGENSTASKFGTIRYYDDTQIEEWCPDLIIEKIYGIRTFWDLQQNQEKHSDEEWQDKMMNLELRVSELDDFVDIAFFHHLVIRKKGI